MSDPTRRYPQITKAVYERPWALQPAMLAVIEEIVRLRAAGSPLADDELERRVAAARAANGPRSGPARAQGVSVIPVYGVLAQRMDLMQAMSGGTSIESITQQFREALADPDVGAIVFDVDSPGGSVEGVTELASEIRAARGTKPMAAVANASMASAAYWLASQADEVIASPSAIVGSIGIIAAHLDESGADEQAGEKYTLITAGEGKALGNSHEPLDDEGRAELQGIADDYYELFAGDVARARAVPLAKVTGDWKASVFTAAKAQAAGLVDRVDTLDATVRRLIVDANRAPARAAAYGVYGDALPPEAGVAALLATMPIQQQLAVLAEESERVRAHFAEKARLRAKEGRSLSATTEERLAALEPPRSTQGDDDQPALDTDEPEEADPPTPEATRRRRPALELYDAAARGYVLPASNEVSPT